ncbi:MAG: serine/threonine protein kinase [Planctomycetes bacterium]|nr:serine/threonine protein kinase [Planctomycetota bacterium]
MQRIPRLPGYELFQYLGGGPLTAVYAGRDCATDELCAVKVLRDDWEDQPTAVKLLQREARAGLKVRDPRLVRLLHAHVTRAPHFLVMELLPGESLRRRLQREYRLGLPDALWVARQTAEAVAALHRAGFLHGDVKPDNVRLVRDGAAVLIDLGFAHRPGENAVFLREGYILGTPDYLAPELCLSRPEADLSSDLFSLGVMLFEMLTGQLPYPPGSLNQTFRRHGCDPPADIRRLAGPLPGSLVRLVERLLARRPEERPRAGAVVRQLIAQEIAALRRRAG